MEIRDEGGVQYGDRAPPESLGHWERRARLIGPAERVKALDKSKEDARAYDGLVDRRKRIISRDGRLNGENRTSLFFFS